MIERTGRRLRRVGGKFAAVRRVAWDLISGRTVRLPTRTMSSAEYAAHSERADWHEVFPAERLSLREPRVFGASTANFRHWLIEDIRPLGVLDMHGGYLVGGHGWVVGPDRMLLSDHSWYGAPLELDMNLRRCFTDRSERTMSIMPSVGVDRLEGTVLSLASEWAHLNYGHFLLESLPRVELFRRAGFSLDDVDHVVVTPSHPGAKRFLEQLGVADRLIGQPKRRALYADRLIVPSFPGARCSYPRFVAQFLKQEFGPVVTQKPTRRLYLPRTTTRRITNESALREVLDRHGFEVFNPSDSDDPPRRFAEAAVVVSAHGAALTDIVFCRPGTKVLELIPSDHVQPYWYTLANAADLDYSYIVGRSESVRNDPGQTPSPFDFSVDVEAFESAIVELVSELR